MRIILSLVLMCVGFGAWASPYSVPQVSALRANQITESKFYLENRAAILDRAIEMAEDGHAEILATDFETPEQREEAVAVSEATVESLKHERETGETLKVRPLEDPTRRIVDVELGIGFPELVSVCLEGHIYKGFALEACAGSAVIVNSVGANAMYRWNLVVKKGRKATHQLKLGPSAGFRRASVFAILAFGKGWSVNSMASLEYNAWYAKHFGIGVELDAGAVYFLPFEDFSGSEGAWLPMGRLSFQFIF